MHACPSARARSASPPALLVSVYLWLWHSRLIPLCSRRRQKLTSLTCTQVLRGGARAAARWNVLAARTELSQALEEESGGSQRRAEAANEQELNGAEQRGAQSTAQAINQHESWDLRKEYALLSTLADILESSSHLQLLCPNTNYS